MPGRAAYDSALLVYNSPKAAPGDRGYAACAIALYMKDNGKPTDAVQWANRGLGLKPGQDACTSILNPGGN